MAQPASHIAAMREQITSQPALLRDIVEPAAQQVELALREVQPQRWRAVYTAGCGDSYYAGLACEMAFAQLLPPAGQGAGGDAVRALRGGRGGDPVRASSASPIRARWRGRSKPWRWRARRAWTPSP